MSFRERSSKQLKNATRCKPMWELPGKGRIGGSTLPVHVFNPPSFSSMVTQGGQTNPP